MGSLRKLIITKNLKTTGSSISPEKFLHPHGCGNYGCLVCTVMSDFPLVNPHCTWCHGAGFIYPIDDYGNPKYGEAIACPEPHCYAENYRTSGAETLTKTQTFDSFNTKNHKGLKEPYDAAMNFANETGLKIFLHFGDRGCGKTHLLHSIWNYRREQGKPVVKYAMNELFNKLADAMGNNTLEQKSAEACATPMLLLDDLDIAKLTDWKLERFKEIFDYRMQNCLWTHITTHNTLDEIKAKSPDLDDRFADLTKCLCVFNEAPSHRKETRKVGVK